MARAFKLSSGDNDFNSRVSSLFASLNEVAVDLPSSTKETSSDSNKRGTKRECGPPYNLDDPAENAFRVPSRRNIPQRKKKIPDFKSHPEKWTKYDMSDTAEMDDSQNRKAALQLLSDLNANKNSVNEALMEDTPQKIVFKKASSKPELKESEDTKTTLPFDAVTNRKFVMDEYEVGKSSRKKKQSRGPKPIKAAATVKLSYLEFEDDPEE